MDTVSAIKPRPFYDLRQMLEGPAYYYFKKEDEVDLIDVIVRVAIGKHREWIHNMIYIEEIISFQRVCNIQTIVRNVIILKLVFIV